MTKMAVVPIYGKKTKPLCPVTVLVDSRLSNCCPWGTCLFDFLFDFLLRRPDPVNSNGHIGMYFLLIFSTRS